MRDVRTRWCRAVFGGLPGVEALVTGDAAFTPDVVGFYTDGDPGVRVRPRALVPAAARRLPLDRHPDQGDHPQPAVDRRRLRVSSWSSRKGWGADILNVNPASSRSFVPIFIFTILFGLSMDYHVFILTRIKEAAIAGSSSTPRSSAASPSPRDDHERGRDHGRGLRGVRHARLTFIQQLGFGLAVAVFLDATIVRSVLLPASMRSSATGTGGCRGSCRGCRGSRSRASRTSRGSEPTPDPAPAPRRDRVAPKPGSVGRLGAQPGTRTSTQTGRWSDEGTGKPVPVRYTSGSVAVGQKTARRRSRATCAAARSRRAGCPGRCTAGRPGVSQKSAVSYSGSLSWLSFRASWTSAQYGPPALDGVTLRVHERVVESCWVEPGMLSPSSGSLFWSPAITNVAPGLRPPYVPSSS